MKSYLVSWEIEVDADSAEEAVALAAQMLPTVGNDSTATAFTVRSDAGVMTVVDLVDIGLAPK